MAVICVSQQFGSGGRVFSERLAKRLGYECVDHEVVSIVAKEAGVSEEWVAAQERNLGAVSEVGAAGLTGSSIIARLTGRKVGEFDQSRLIGLLKKVIPDVAARGNVIFLGRGAQFILPPSRKTIKILLVASESHRTRFIMDYYHLDEKEAGEAVRDWADNRQAFYREFNVPDPDDPTQYTMVFNTARLDLNGIEESVVRFVQTLDA
jgi:CMP/dCMP kinase